MLTQKLRLGLRALVIAAAVGTPATAFAHAFVLSPPSRDVAVANLDARAHKNGPCGNDVRTKATNYKVGETVNVKWQETIDHRGCFQVAFSPADDKDWVVLKQMDDPAGTPDDFVWNTDVTLPAGVSCKACTIVVRQLMVGGACVGNPADPAAAAQGTYYSCADICVGADCPDGGAPASDAGTGQPGTDSGVSTTPTDGGGKLVEAGDGDGDDGARPNLHAGDGGGCSVALGATSGASLGITAGLFGLALLLRRRNKR